MQDEGVEYSQLMLAGGPAAVDVNLSLGRKLCVTRFRAFCPSACCDAVYELRRDDASRYYEYRSLPPRSKPPATVFGLRLRQARLHAGMPQDKLGVAIGLDEMTASTRVSRYETGVHATPYPVAQQLAAVLGVPTAFLYCEDDDLAGVILGWGHLSAKDRKRVVAVMGLGAEGRQG